MAATFILNKDSYRKQVIKEVCEAWVEVAPAQAREMARYVNEVSRVKRKPSAAWRSGCGYHAIDFPADLWHSMRAVFDRKGIEPKFGDDDADIRFVCKEFPALFKSNKHNLPAWKRPMTRPKFGKWLDDNWNPR